MKCLENVKFVGLFLMKSPENFLQASLVQFLEKFLLIFFKKSIEKFLKLNRGRFSMEILWEISVGISRSIFEVFHKANYRGICEAIHAWSLANTLWNFCRNSSDGFCKMVFDIWDENASEISKQITELLQGMNTRRNSWKNFYDFWRNF